MGFLPVESSACDDAAQARRGTSFATAAIPKSEKADLAVGLFYC
jgi:hypothetical protein